SIHNYVNNGDGSLVNIISNAVDQVLNKSPITIEKFDYLLSQYKIERTNTKRGNVYNINADNNTNKNTVPGSSLYNNSSKERVLNTLEFNKERKNNHLKSMMGKVYFITNTINENNNIQLEIFNLLLKKKGIKLKVKRRKSGNEKGKINGFIFKDLKTNIEYTATDLKLRLKDFEYVIDDKSDLNILTKEKENKSLLDFIEHTTNEEYQ
ncbi:hypothetical protein, partial [Tenacibaculum ovolyticum]|uniref:hypothetical protein n=1 Tax=Tenacibaculum ovolyticum TaxID=104270 RepID=UPI000A8D97DC